MKGLVIILVATLMSLPSCATKRKTKQVERIEVVTENQVKNDSSADIKIERSSHDYLSNYSSNESLLSKLGLVFNGKSNEDKGSFSIKETDQGLQMDISGALQMALDKTHSKDETFTKAEAIKLFDSIIKANLQQNKTERSEQLLDSFKSETQKEKTDISFWIYVVIGSVLVVGTVVYITIKYF
ncbi:MAG: hypothetical protein KIG88_11835 [Weeksellaceae bacterium]|nr:hypothetical protein [Weeksellaceae bacterium]